MKKILFILFVLMASVAFGQGVRLKTGIAGFNGSQFIGIPPGYTKLNVRYEFVAMAIDSGLHVPQYNGVPSGVRTGVWVADGAVAVDTLNGYFYWYSGGAWIKGAKYSDIGAAYTAGDGLLLTGSEFKVLTKRSITIDNDSLMLVNDSTASPVSYFYGTNVAGRKGWYAQSSLDPYTFTNGLTESGGTVKLGGTLVDATTTISGDGKDLIITNLAALNIDGTEPFNIQVSSGGSSGVLTVDGGNSQFVSTRTGATSTFKVDEDSIISKPHIGAYYIDTLLYTLSTTGKKIMLRDTASGLVQNIDPALLTVSGVTAGSQGQIYQTSNGAAAWKYDTTTLVTFNAGANFAADTAAFTDSTIYGSFKLMGNDTFYVTGVSVVLYSNNAITDTLGIQITYNDTINVIGSHVFAATYAVNNGTTGQDADGDDFTGSNSVPIPPGNWVWLKSPTVVAGRKPYHLSVSIIGYKKRVN